MTRKVHKRRTRRRGGRFPWNRRQDPIPPVTQSLPTYGPPTTEAGRKFRNMILKEQENQEAQLKRLNVPTRNSNQNNALVNLFPSLRRTNQELLNKYGSMRSKPEPKTRRNAINEGSKDYVELCSILRKRTQALIQKLFRSNNVTPEKIKKADSIINSCLKLEIEENPKKSDYDTAYSLYLELELAFK